MPPSNSNKIAFHSQIFLSYKNCDGSLLLELNRYSQGKKSWANYVLTKNHFLHNLETLTSIAKSGRCRVWKYLRHAFNTWCLCGIDSYALLLLYSFVTPTWNTPLMIYTWVFATWFSFKVVMDSFYTNTVFVVVWCRSTDVFQFVYIYIHVHNYNTPCLWSIITLSFTLMFNI